MAVATLIGWVETQALATLNPDTMPLSAGRMFLSSRFVWGVLFAMMSTVFMIYQVERAGLNPLQLVLVGTALEVSAFLFEIPTGVIADRYSRKLSVIAGFIITGISFILAAAFPVFEIIALGSFLWGIGWTFISGAHEAWLADEVGESDAAKLYLQGQKLVGYGGFLGILVAVVLGSVGIHYPYLLSGFLFIVWGGFCWFGMIETRFRPMMNPNHLAGMKQTFAEGVMTIRHSPVLVLLVIVGVVIGTFSEGYDRLAAAHMLRNFEFPRPWDLEPVVLFGAMAAASNLLAIVAVQVIESRVDTERASQIGAALSLVSLMILLATLMFALTGHILVAIALYVLIMPMRVVSEPLTIAWINQHVGSSARATVLSMHSQSDALGQMMGGPAVGVVGQFFGIRVAISVAAVLLAPAIFLYRRARALA